MLDEDQEIAFNLVKEGFEFNGGHLKELKIFDKLSESESAIPKIYKIIQDDKREVYALLMQFLNSTDMKIINSEMNSSLWDKTEFREVVSEHFRTLTKISEFNESPLFSKASPVPQSFFSYYRTYLKQFRLMAIIAGMIFAGTILIYLDHAFTVTYMTNMLQYTHQQALATKTISILLLVFLIPLMGKLSYYIGRRTLLASALIGGYVLFLRGFFRRLFPQ